MRTGSLALAALGLMLSSCIAQTPPDRSALPDVASVVTTPPSCRIVNGPPTGAFVEEVTAASGSDGVLLPSDVIVDIDGLAVSSAGDLLAVLAERNPGDVIQVRAERGGQTLSLDVTLGANPRSPERPLMGVMITTAYDEEPPPTSPSSTTFGPLSRMVTIDGAIYAFDPETLQFAPTDYEPATTLALVSAGNQFRVDREGDVPQLLDRTGQAVPVAGGATPLGLLGTAGGELIVVTQGTIDDANDGPAVERISPNTGASLWRWQPAEGVPVIAVASPDASKLLVGLAVGEVSGLRFRLISNLDGTEITRPDQLEAINDGVAFGWFDDERVLVQAPGMSPALLDTNDLSITPVELQLDVTLGVRVWAVGDGEGVLVASGDTLYLSGLDPSVQTRPLTRRCDIGFVDQVGSGA